MDKVLRSKVLTFEAGPIEEYFFIRVKPFGKSIPEVNLSSILDLS